MAKKKKPVDETVDATQEVLNTIDGEFEPVVEPTPKKSDCELPDVQVVFDNITEAQWASKAYFRRSNAYRSIRVEADAMVRPDWMIGLAVKALLTKYHIMGEQFDGLLYIHKRYAKHPAVAAMERLGECGKYIILRKK